MNMYFNQLVIQFLLFLFCFRYSLFVLKVRRWGVKITSKHFTLSAAEEKLLHESQGPKDLDLTKDWGLAEILYGKKSFTIREAIREQSWNNSTEEMGTVRI